MKDNIKNTLLRIVLCLSRMEYLLYDKIVKRRNESWIKIEKATNNSEAMNKLHLKGLLRTLNTLYFQIEDNWNINKILNVLKDIILNFYSREKEELLIIGEKKR